MINELFQIDSYSYQPRRPRYQNKTGEADKLQKTEVFSTDKSMSGHDIRVEPSAQGLSVSVETAGMEITAHAEKIQNILEDNKENSKENITLAMNAYKRNGFDIGSTINKAV